MPTIQFITMSIYRFVRQFKYKRAFLRRQRKRIDQVFGKYRPNKELCLSA